MVAEGFEQEKSRRSTEIGRLRPGYGPFEVDPGIYHAVMAINGLPFAYTNLACSGTRADHGGFRNRTVFGNPELSDDEGGYVWVTADTSDPGYQDFVTCLIRMGARIVDIKSFSGKVHRDASTRDLIVQFAVPPAKTHEEGYLSGKWREMADFLGKNYPVFQNQEEFEEEPVPIM